MNDARANAAEIVACELRASLSYLFDLLDSEQLLTCYSPRAFLDPPLGEGGDEMLPL